MSVTPFDVALAFCTTAGLSWEEKTLAGPFMNFYNAFARTLAWRPLQALQALYWHLTGRKVRAQNRLRRDACRAPYAYDLWIETVERAADIAAQTTVRSEEWKYRPLISIVVQCSTSCELNPTEAIRSIRQQSYPEWEIIITDTLDTPIVREIDPRRVRRIPLDWQNAASALDAALHAAQGQFILFLPPDATLPSTALFNYAKQLQSNPDAKILFGDHDQIDHKGKRTNPWFKPQWNEEMFLGQDYISQACILQTKYARQVKPVEAALAKAATYVLALRISEILPTKIVHVPHVVAHLPKREIDGHDQEHRLAAVAQHVARSGARALPGTHGLVRIQWPLPNTNPLVSIIIPTRDRTDLLRVCLESLSSRTIWHPYEIIVVDNQSNEPETFRYLDYIRQKNNVKVLKYPHPYNYSAINNFAASQAQGTYICLLNNDTEIIEPRWLEAMMRQAIRPEVGAVGAKLLYDDGSIQHAGVNIGMGGAAGHAHRFQKPTDRGYFDQVDLTRFVSAVTAACLLVARDKFDAVGGLDQEVLHVAYNDIDLCLKLQEAGWKNVYEPAATLIHYESKSRGSDFSPANLDRYLGELQAFQNRWNTVKTIDPLHHPHLDRSQETYVINF